VKARRVRNFIALAFVLDNDICPGTCDWGECNNATLGMRWEPERREYLAVCYRHSREAQ
jgi:hypothetical protein